MQFEQIWWCHDWETKQAKHLRVTQTFPWLFVFLRGASRINSVSRPWGGGTRPPSSRRHWHDDTCRLAHRLAWDWDEPRNALGMHGEGRRRRRKWMRVRAKCRKGNGGGRGQSVSAMSAMWASCVYYVGLRGCQSTRLLRKADGTEWWMMMRLSILGLSYKSQTWKSVLPWTELRLCFYTNKKERKKHRDAIVSGFRHKFKQTFLLQLKILSGTNSKRRFASS